MLGIEKWGKGYQYPLNISENLEVLSFKMICLRVRGSLAAYCEVCLRDITHYSFLIIFILCFALASNLITSDVIIKNYAANGEGIK